MANRQVRLDAQNTAWVEEWAYDWDCSLSAAVNRLLRELRDPPAKPQMGRKLAKPAAKVPRTTQARLATLLQQNADYG